MTRLYHRVTGTISRLRNLLNPADPGRNPSLTGRLPRRAATAQAPGGGRHAKPLSDSGSGLRLRLRVVRVAAAASSWASSKSSMETGWGRDAGSSSGSTRRAEKAPSFLEAGAAELGEELPRGRRRLGDGDAVDDGEAARAAVDDAAAPEDDAARHVVKLLVDLRERLAELDVGVGRRLAVVGVATALEGWSEACKFFPGSPGSCAPPIRARPPKRRAPPRTC